MSVKKIATIGVLCAMAMVVNVLIHFPIVPAASFMNYDPKDIVIVTGGFIMGPMAVVIMSSICSVLELMIRGGTIIDLIMNIFSTCAFACTAALIYQKKHTKKGALLGLLSGVLVSVVVMMLWNYIVTPIYYQMPREAVIAMLPAIFLFNILKYGLNAALTLALYKPLVTILRRSSLVEKHGNDKKSGKGMLLLGLFLAVTILCIVLSLKGLI